VEVGGAWCKDMMGGMLHAPTWFRIIRGWNSPAYCRRRGSGRPRITGHPTKTCRKTRVAAGRGIGSVCGHRWHGRRWSGRVRGLLIHGLGLIVLLVVPGCQLIDSSREHKSPHCLKHSQWGIQSIRGGGGHRSYTYPASSSERPSPLSTSLELTSESEEAVLGPLARTCNTKGCGGCGVWGVGVCGQRGA
jgi:hypothetical protein